MYTRFLVEGIRTGAADLQRRGFVDVKDLHNYVESRLQELAPLMSPQLIATGAGREIWLSRVPRDSTVDYRQKVEELAKRRRGVINKAGRMILQKMRADLPEGEQISDEQAEQIEAEVLGPWREYAKKLAEFEALVAELVSEGQGLSALDWQDLRDLQAHIRLAEADLIEIFAKHGIAANPLLALAGDQSDRSAVYSAGSSPVVDVSAGQELLALSVETALVVRARADSGEVAWRIDKHPLQVQGYRELLADGVELTMVQIPAGSFLMGSPAEELGRYGDEGPQHRVELAEFLMGQTPITQAQWRVVAAWQPRDGESWGRQLNPNPSYFQAGDNQKGGEARLFDGEANTDQRPVEQVSWQDAIEFCKRLSQRTGRHYRLPSEAQWEYACRAGSSTPFHFGETISPALANYIGNHAYADGPKGDYRQQTTPVSLFPANPWGLHDMHGNVWEWCQDQWHDNYNGAPQDGSAWLNLDVDNDYKRLLRGGSWYYLPGLCRSAFRSRPQPGFVSSALGLRVVCLPQGCSS
jgi:formylglycine-generating enzyme required for sulfatase activity